MKRLRDCGHVPVSGDGAGPVLKVLGDRTAYLSGLAHCGSVWACPVCAATIATRRAEELADVMRLALEQGCSASMVTLTMRHHKGQSLRQCWRAASKAWARVTSGKQWEQDQALAGLRGWVKAVEVTHGENGWHVHLHVLMIWQTDISEDAAQCIGERMWARWARALRRNGFDSLMNSGGLDVRKASLNPERGGGLHEYFMKMAHEITNGQGKQGRFGGRAPFELLTDALATGLADDIERWWEWEQASKGRRQMAWSKGAKELRKLAGLAEEEATDEEIANEDVGGDELVGLDPEGWRRLRHHPELVCGLLEAAERRGMPGALAWLDHHGIGWVLLGNRDGAAA